MPLEHAGPLCSAGITTYSPLARYIKGKKDQAVGVVGFGGLGHMAIKLDVAMGAKVTVFSAEALSATLVVYTDKEAMAKLGRSQNLIVDTVTVHHEINDLIGTLKAYTGVMTMIGGVPQPYQMNGFPMIFNGTLARASVNPRS